MKNIFYLFLLICFSTSAASAQTIWTGPKMTFTKTDSADWKLAANQDRITDSLWITRAHRAGIFNIQRDTNYVAKSPTNSEWALGTTADLSNLVFESWENAINANPLTVMLNKDMVLHIIDSDIYIDIKFTQWTSSAKGGGFSYERSTPQVVATHQTQATSYKVYPNPVHDELFIESTQATGTYRLVDMLGATRQAGRYQRGQALNVADLSAGIYLLQLDNTKTQRLIKR